MPATPSSITIHPNPTLPTHPAKPPSPIHDVNADAPEVFVVLPEPLLPLPLWVLFGDALDVCEATNVPYTTKENTGFISASLLLVHRDYSDRDHGNNDNVTTDRSSSQRGSRSRSNLASAGKGH
ncbi:hypothetical protein ONZ51_g1528 [Trametes cubensis]|uniref:Uncharacterized protein n=1 Tax=Trametes cubensis TaxID=1111947 RepID=A0AAD7XFQ3_9APHY|nr:hypothetical protein ONZ51_g1528 [Trametes cubensis]